MTLFEKYIKYVSKTLQIVLIQIKILLFGTKAMFKKTYFLLAYIYVFLNISLVRNQSLETFNFSGLVPNNNRQGKNAWTNTEKPVIYMIILESFT